MRGSRMLSSTTYRERSLEFASAITCDGTDEDRAPLGSGRPVVGCRNRRRALGTSATGRRIHVRRLSICVNKISLLKNFRVLNFCGLPIPTKIL